MRKRERKRGEKKKLGTASASTARRRLPIELSIHFICKSAAAGWSTSKEPRPFFFLPTLFLSFFLSFFLSLCLSSSFFFHFGNKKKNIFLLPLHCCCCCCCCCWFRPLTFSTPLTSTGARIKTPMPCWFDATVSSFFIISPSPGLWHGPTHSPAPIEQSIITNRSDHRHYHWVSGPVFIFLYLLLISICLVERRRCPGNGVANGKKIDFQG